MPPPIHVKDDERFEAFGFKVPLPPWAVSVLAAVVIMAVGIFLWRKIVDDPDKIVTDLKAVNRDMAFQVDEYGRHAMEDPIKHEALEDADGGLLLRVYTDHCVLIQRRTRDGMLTKLVPDLARSRVRAESRQVPPPPSWSILPTVSAQGRCWNPHPGPFTWWYGGRRGDWVEVWRQWPDGCRHFQMMHVPSGAWATNPDGSPSVNWITCVH